MKRKFTMQWLAVGCFKVRRGGGPDMPTPWGSRGPQDWSLTPQDSLHSLGSSPGEASAPNAVWTRPVLHSLIFQGNCLTFPSRTALTDPEDSAHRHCFPKRTPAPSSRGWEAGRRMRASLRKNKSFGDAGSRRGYSPLLGPPCPSAQDGRRQHPVSASPGTSPPICPQLRVPPTPISSSKAPDVCFWPGC